MTTATKTTKRETVKIFGQTVTVGTKKHAILVQQKRHFDGLLASETN
jgi:hypothetical protein